MPAYQTAPNGAKYGLQMGVPAYSAGSLGSQANSKMFVTSAAVASNVVTLGVIMQAGNIPAVGATAYVTGTTQGSASLNKATGVTLTGVTITAATGVGTITYSQTTTDLATTKDGGLVIVPVQEVGDALAANTSFLQFAVPAPIGGGGGRTGTITWSTVVGGAPATILVNLQASIVDIDGQYATLDSSSSATGETRYIAQQDFNFFRIRVTTLTGGTSPTLVAKLLV